MAILFHGRFDRHPASGGTGGASFDAYNRIDRDPEDAALPPLSGGEPGSYEYADGVAGIDRVARLTIGNTSPARCELRPYYEDPEGSGPVYGERWIWWSTLLPVDWVVEHARGIDTAVATPMPNQRVIIGQIHVTPDGGDATHYPALQLYVIGDRYELALTADEGATTSQRAPNLIKLSSWPALRETWVDWVVHANLAANSDGFLHFYKDGRLEFSVTGQATVYNDAVGPYFKAGMYAFGDSRSPAQRSLYTRGIVIGDAASSHLEVSGLTVKERSSMRRRTA